MSPRSKSVHPLRRQLAHSAAKLIAVDGINDYFAAKKKAAEKLGIDAGKHYPSNKEIEQALIDYQRLFQAQQQSQTLHLLRSKALKALKLFAPLEPYLVGPIVTGTANEHSEIVLHIYSETPQAIAVLLSGQQIPFEECERRARFKHHDSRLYPAFQFFAERHKVLLMVFPERQKHHPPLDPVDNHPVQRLDYLELETLLNTPSDSA